ncbi:hypothetical protein GCM10022222_01640 [Amycolatopsis ultiminotia]|uniref:Phosphotriesterase-related protein n=1 Tax=Amycolatopsis ultiminotia TaxID=543629 RepID=A0ABP6UVA6_9PSEU
MVETVRGAVPPEALGRVLMHEHIFVLSPEFVVNYPEHDGFDEAVHVPEAIGKLRELKAAGIDTIVDPTVIGLGRYLPRVQAVAAATDLQIVVATGLYTYRDVPHYLSMRGPGTPLGGPEPLVEMFVGDLTEGIADTGVKAGVLQVRHRRAGPYPRGRAGAARGCAGTPADRRADHDPHARGHAAWAGAAERVRVRGRGSAAGADRALR